MLRDWREDDAPALEPVCGDWDVCQFTSVPWTYSAPAARAWVRRINERRSGTALALAITRERDDVALGNVNLVDFDDHSRAPELGYWLVPSARGQRLSVRSASLLCSWAFANLRLVRIELAILPGNIASQAVAEQLGAVREGLRRDSHEAGGRR